MHTFLKNSITISILLISGFSSGQPNVDYNVFYSEQMASQGLKVSLAYRLKKAADSTCFRYSDEVWGDKNLMDCIVLLQNENPGYRFKIVPESSRIIVYHPKTKNIHLTYRIKQDYETESINPINRPRVKNEFFHILGQSLFVVPETFFENNNPVPRITATIAWMGFPEHFKIHNTFGTGQKKQVITANLEDQFYNSLFVGGDYRIYAFHYLNKPIYFAIRGTWFKDYSDARLLETLKKTISMQRAFWNDNSFDYYTVIFTPTTTTQDSIYKGQSINGSGVRNGFLIQSTNNSFNSFATIRYLFNHEMMHDWIGGKIPMKNEELNYWFSEGFTDYYTYKNRLRKNDLSEAQWFEDFNKDVLKAHWLNPERNKPNYIIKDDFWKDRNVEKIPYRKGAIFAFWMDNQILKKSHYKKSLDDLMRDLLSVCTTTNRKFTDELFLDYARKYLDEDITYFFQKHIINGVDFDIQNDDLIETFRIEYRDHVPTLKQNGKMAGKYFIE